MGGGVVEEVGSGVVENVGGGMAEKALWKRIVVEWPLKR